MKQIGIIYKFTIIAKYKFDGHKPFYVGQHFGNLDEYWGSGRIWTDFITRIKLDFPTCWKKLIKKVVLYQRPCSQKCLDKMEEYFIKKEKAHYSYKSGGCNILWGTANNFGSGSPMKDPLVAKRCGESLKKYRGKKSHSYGRKLSEETKRKLSEFHLGKVGPNKGKKMSEETRKKMSEAQSKRMKNPKNNPMYGKHHTEETKCKMRKNHADISGDKNPMKKEENVKRFITSRNKRLKNLK